MAILNNDIKLMEPQRLSNESDGGGRMTGREIVDGLINNLFPDISRLARVYGNVYVLKFFVAVMTENSDTFYGSHVIITDAPDDPNVSVILFYTGSHTDTRTDVQEQIESYVVRGPKTNMELLETQLQGQRAIITYQPESASIPEIGETLVIIENEDQTNEKEQYVRITEVSHELRTFFKSGGCGEFKRRVVTMGISEPLRHTFYGDEANCSTISHNAVLRTTQVADAAKYYSIVPIAEPVAAGVSDILVQSIYAQIVPTTRIESALIDLQAGGERSVSVQSGSLTLDIVDVAYTYQIDIYQQNRSYNYTANLQPIPAQGTVIVEYRALGKWYQLVDDGTGVLVGEGTGTINFETGSIIVTLKSLADVGSSIIFYWGTTIHYQDKSGSSNFPNMRFTGNLSATGIFPGTFNISWVGGGNNYSVSDDGQGHLTGDGTGYIVYANGKMVFEPNKLPDSTSYINFTYDYYNPTTVPFTPTKDIDGFIEVIIPETPLKPGSVLVNLNVVSLYLNTDTHGFAGFTNEFITYLGGSVIATIEIADDGTGKLQGMADSEINYATGRVYFNPELSFKTKFMQPYSYGGGAIIEWETKIYEANFDDETQIDVTYQLDSVTGNNGAEQIAPPPIILDLTQNVYASNVVPGSVRFRVGNMDYSDRSGQGILYNANDVIAGNVNYNTGIATIDNYVGGSTNNVYVNSLIVTPGNWSLTEIVFRTAGAPLQPGGFHVRATALDGTLISGSDNLSGAISASLIEGIVEQDIGIVSLRFGKSVLDASLTAEEKNKWWYDPADVDGNGYIWKPKPVYPNTVKYNIVVYSNLPLDASLLGLDPVRLPPDGRVPVIRKADMIVIHESKTQVVPVEESQTIPNEEQETLPNPLSAGQIVNLSDNNMAVCLLEDQNGDQVDEALYSVDLATGKVTMADPLDLSAYTQPLVAKWRNSLQAAQIINLGDNDMSVCLLEDQNSTQIDEILYSVDLATGKVTMADPLDLSAYTQPLVAKWRNSLQAGEVIPLVDDNIAKIEGHSLVLKDQNGLTVEETTYYTTDFVNGEITMVDPLDLSGFVQPLIAHYRIEDMSLVGDVQINGTITCNNEIIHDYSTNALVSTVLIPSPQSQGDLFSKVESIFFQSTWTNQWADTRIGSDTVAKYNYNQYPILVQNNGAIKERWALIFTSSTTFNIVGETVGVINTGDILTLASPLNPETLAPYFSINQNGFGSGWSTGNVIRFNTRAAADPVWCIRTVLSGPTTQDSDHFKVQVRGDAD